MKSELKAASWALGLWGALSIIFGVMIMAWPGITLKAFLIILAMYLVAVGVVMLVGAIVNREGRWIGTALVGVISAVAGLYVFANPQISALVALSVIAVWAIAVGMLQIVAGFEGKNNWLMIFAGAVYTLFGFYIFANPAGGALTLVWLIGLSTIISGVFLVVAAFEANNLDKKLVKAK
jgi:uncharacterized membrane protein HdeD (DUF308 family)